MRKLPQISKLQLQKRVVTTSAFLRKNRRVLLRYGLISLLLLFVAATLTAKLSGERYANQIRDARTDLQRNQDQLNGIIQPSEIEIGQQDLSVDYLLNQTNPKTFRPEPVNPPSRLMVFIHLLPTASHNYSALSKAENVKHDIKDVTDYHYEVIAALESVLEYNPRADFADKTLNEEEIDLRIANARAGLNDALNKLTRISDQSIEDPNRNELTRSIRRLQASHKLFDDERDMEAWFEAVETEQKIITDNRQQFWTKQATNLFTLINTRNRELAELESAIRR